MCNTAVRRHLPDYQGIRNRLTCWRLKMTKKLRALTTVGALVLAGAFGVAVVATGGTGNGATLGMFLAGGYAAYQLMRDASE
nr:MAG TPA: hypothetical protein [Caudoviricetes sp.]